MDSSEEASPLLMLPTEVFLYICSYLDSIILAKSVRLVCKKFYSILGDKSVWKKRFPKDIQDKFALLPVNEGDSNWLKACCLTEHEYKHWKNFEKGKCTEHIHESEVYSVLLMNAGNLCISGSSEKGLSVWSVQRGHNPEVVSTLHKPDAHRGSVLGLLEKDSKLLSCSYDGTVKLWDVSVGLQVVDSAEVMCPVMCMTTTNESPLVAAGTRRGRVRFFDVRSNLSLCKDYSSRKCVIRAMAMFGNTLVAVNEAGFILAWDIRMDKTFAKINLKRFNDEYGTCLSYAENALYVGDANGFLHLIEPKEMKLIASEKLDHFFEVYAVKYTAGSIIATFEDMFCVGTPTWPPDFYTDLGIQNNYGAFDYSNGVLVTGYEQEYIRFLLPID